MQILDGWMDGCALALMDVGSGFCASAGSRPDRKEGYNASDGSKFAMKKIVLIMSEGLFPISFR